MEGGQLEGDGQSPQRAWHGLWDGGGGLEEGVGRKDWIRRNISCILKDQPDLVAAGMIDYWDR